MIPVPPPPHGCAAPAPPFSSPPPPPPAVEAEENLCCRPDGPPGHDGGGDSSSTKPSRLTRRMGAVGVALRCGGADGAGGFGGDEEKMLEVPAAAWCCCCRPDVNEGARGASAWLDAELVVGGTSSSRSWSVDGAPYRDSYESIQAKEVEELAGWGCPTFQGREGGVFGVGWDGTHTRERPRRS